MSVRIPALYAWLSQAQGRIGALSFGQVLLYVLLALGGLFLIIEIGALVMGLALARSITGSVHELFAGTERVRAGRLHAQDRASARDDQLGELAESFNSMTASIEDLLPQMAEKKRLEEELRIAREIQMSLLPQGPLGVAGPLGDGALRAGAGSRRRLLRLPAARPTTRRRPHRGRVGQGHVGGALHGRAEGADAVAQPQSPARRASC